MIICRRNFEYHVFIDIMQYVNEHNYVVSIIFISLHSRNLMRAEAEIGELSAGLDDVDKQVAVLKEKLNKSTKEAAEVEFHLNKAKETITAAERLVTQLEGEYQRWSQQVRFGLDLFKTYRSRNISFLGPNFFVLLKSKL